MTPCEERGYKVGDRFVVYGSIVFEDGSTVELYEEGHSDIPLFKLIKGKCDYRHAGGKDGAYESLDFVTPVISAPNPITTLRTAKAELDAARDAYSKALDAVRGELGDGFMLVEAESVPMPGEDMTDPANWREGDVVECISDVSPCFTKGKTYELTKWSICDQIVNENGNIRIIEDDEGDMFHAPLDDFRFHHRPNT